LSNYVLLHLDISRKLSRIMQTLKNNLLNSMDLLLNCAYDFAQQYARSIVKIAFNVSKTKLFSNACIFQIIFLGYSR
jgi:hypothetical protein